MRHNITTEDFIKKASRIHNNKFNYSRVNYKDWNTPVCIICPTHGAYKTTPNCHYKSDCPECSCKKISTSTFITKATQIHGTLYDYSKVNYKDMHTAVNIICKKHNKEFSMQPCYHIRMKYGCPLCGSGKNRTTDDFILLSKEVHKNYNYQQTNYTNAKSKVLITCLLHGDFSQRPDDHLRGQGCPLCYKKSKYEEQIYLELQKYFQPNEIKREHKFRECIDEKQLKFDFFIPSKNLVIEYDGEHHFKPVNYSGKQNRKLLLEHLEEIQKHDTIKNLFCKENNIDILRISYYNKMNIREIIRRKICGQ